VIDRTVRRWARPAPSLALLLGAVLAAGVPGAAQTAGEPAAAPAPAAAHGDAPRPGDLIRLRVWREPDYSGEFEVSVDGVAVFPRIGAMHVAADAPAVLQQKLIDRFRPFLNHSSIEVTLLRRVQVTGAVRTPGLYTVDPTMTLGDVLALAGGTTPEGHPRRIEVLRRGERVTASVALGDRVMDSAIRSGDQVLVPERSWLSRNPALTGAGISAVASLLIALLLR
jgi:protein involved in polysaccharide export with SLBB domain